MSYTKGPWNIDPNEALIVSTKTSVQFIAMLGDTINDFGNTWDDPCMTDEVRSNALLIAAAPDMRGVLEKNLRDMDKIDEVCRIAGVHLFSQMRSDIMAAIAKAEGKNNDSN